MALFSGLTITAARGNSQRSEYRPADLLKDARALAKRHKSRLLSYSLSVNPDSGHVRLVASVLPKVAGGETVLSMSL
jgi:hypothetical protein